MVEIEVQSYSGYRAEQRPQSLFIDGIIHEVAEILKAWVEPERRYFKVKTKDGMEFLIHYDEVEHRWFLDEFDG